VSSRTYRSAASVGPGTYRATGVVDPDHAPAPARTRGQPGRTTGAGPSGRKRHKDPLWAKLLIVFGALLMMTSGGVIVGGRMLLSTATDSVNQRNLLGAAGGPEGNNIDGPINLLLLGLDFRDNGQEDLVRADTIIILHIPASHDQAYLVSIPRDLRVHIPDYPKNNFKGWTTKINAAFAYGHRGKGTEEEKRARGVELLALTIQQNLAPITFNGAAIIDFAGFEKILAELGSVTICVDQEAESIHLAENKEGKLQRVWYDDKRGKVMDVLPGYAPVKYKPGCQELTPEKALDYSRIRKSLKYGDYDRQRHQQQLIKAMAQKATSKGMLTSPAKLLRVAEAAGKALTLDTQGVKIEDFFFTLKGVAANDMVLVRTNAGKTNTIPGSSDEALTEESKQMFQAVANGTLMQWLAMHPHFIANAG